MMKILFASAEVAPFAKVGGLADVAGSLPVALAERGHDLRVIMPKYPSVTQSDAQLWRAIPDCPVPMSGGPSGCSLDESRLPESEVPIYFVEHHDYFSREGIYGPPGGAYPDNLERLTFFCRAVLAVLEPLGWQPEVIHLNDWHTALLAVYLKDRPPATVFTIHNLGPGYQGTFPEDELPVTGLQADYPCVREFVGEGQVNLAAAGLACADMVNTVSPTYAQEIADSSFSGNLAKLVRRRGQDLWGILNGLDYEVWNPTTDKALVSNYDADDLSGKAEGKAALQREAGLPEAPEVPLVGMVTRLDAQKGLDLLAQALPQLAGMQLVILGTGAPKYEKVLRQVSQRREEVTAFLSFDRQLARRIYAGADLFLMPSRYEPCGLGQMIAMRYGTIPVVRATGGLADSVTERGHRGHKQNGYVFSRYSARDMLAAIGRALRTYRKRPRRWQELVRCAMRSDFTWSRSAEQYEKLYQAARGE